MLEVSFNYIFFPLLNIRIFSTMNSNNDSIFTSTQDTESRSAFLFMISLFKLISGDQRHVL